jgi:hypothetical protein
MTAQGKIFFSYSRDDLEFAQRLAQDLRNAGHGIWFDKLDIPTGSKWDESIEAALKSSDALLVVLSPTSVGSQNVMDEVSYSLEHDRRVIPILHQACEIPFRLRRVQHIDFTGDYKSALDRLVEGLTPSGDAPAATAVPVETHAKRPPARETAAPKQGRGFKTWIVGAVIAVAAAFGLNELLSEGEDEGGYSGFDTEIAGTEEPSLIEAPPVAQGSPSIHDLVDDMNAADRDVRLEARMQLESEYLTDANAVSVTLGLLIDEPDLRSEGRINAMRYLAMTEIGGWNGELLQEAQEWCDSVDRSSFESDALDQLADFEAHLDAIAQQL